MIQANGPDNKKDALQAQEHIEPPVVYSQHAWPVILALGMVAVAGIGVAALVYFSKAITDVAAAYNFIAQNTLSLFIFLAVIAQALIYLSQRNLMHKQWEVLKEQSSTLKAQSAGLAMQVEVMQGQLTAMQDQAESMRSQAKTSRSQVRQVYKQVDLMRDSLTQNERAIKAAEDGVQVSREAFHIGEAPYFGATKIVFRWASTVVKNTGTGPVQRETGQPELIITFMNGGKTPAWHFLCTPHLELGKSLAEADRKWITLDAVHDLECPDSENSFYPSGAEKCLKYRGRGEFSDREIEAIKGRTQTLFLIIDLGYTDMRDKRETRNWIRQLNPTTGRFGDGGARQS